MVESPTRELFMMTYNHPYAQNTYKTTSPELSPKRGPGYIPTGFIPDVNTVSGKRIIRDMMKNHKTAVRQASSIVAEQNSPPRAHISKVYGDKTDFGHDKKLKRRRKGPLIGKTILTRQMRNIDPILHQ